MTREERASAFLQSTTWSSAGRTLVAGDASNRRYERLHRAGETAIFMDAPPEKGEDVGPFIAIAEYLSGIGLSAPKILEKDEGGGFLILEDLGDDLYARVVAQDPSLENLLYTTAVDALVVLHRAAAPDLQLYDPNLMTELAATAFTFYKAGIIGADEPAETTAFKRTFKWLLSELTDGDAVLVQRDYHAENLLWLGDREGVARVGMLDFQDAMLGHPAYDLVSVLQDARRDVPPDTEERMIQHYLGRTGFNEEAFRAAYAALGAQRNLRIIGVFARLSLNIGKTHYVDLIPRVWGLLMRDLQHPALADIAPMIRKALPEPTPQNLAKLKSE